MADKMLHKIKSLLDSEISAEDRTIKIYAELINTYNDLFLNAKTVTVEVSDKHNFHIYIRGAQDRKKNLEIMKLRIEEIIKRNPVGYKKEM